jgi:hypothetical protein
MSNLREAEKAKKALNGFDFEGRTMQVDKYHSSRNQNGNRRALKKRRFKRN